MILTNNRNEGSEAGFEVFTLEIRGIAYYLLMVIKSSSLKGEIQNF